MRPRRGDVARIGPLHPVPPPEDRPPAPSNSPLALLVALVETLCECLPQTLSVREHLPVARPSRFELHDLDVARRIAVGVVIRLRLPERSQALLMLAEEAHHIRKMPKVVSR